MHRLQRGSNEIEKLFIFNPKTEKADGSYQFTRIP